MSLTRTCASCSASVAADASCAGCALAGGYTRLGRRVALKMLRQVLFATEQDRLRFQTEAELASRLDHPHIVPVHELQSCICWEKERP